MSKSRIHFEAAPAALLLLSLAGIVRAQPSPPVSPAPVVNFEYDAQGNRKKVIQAQGVTGFSLTTQSGYDTLDRQTSSTDAKNKSTQFYYNGRQDLTKVTDPRLLDTTYTRNGLGDVTALTSPDTGVAAMTFDAAGNLKTRTDSRGVLATNTYDALNRLTSTVFSKSGYPSRTVTWTYDQTGAGFSNGVGRLTSTSHPDGSGQYAYDAQGRLLTETQVVNAKSGSNLVARTYNVSYTYDAAGNVTSVVYPSGRMVTIAYSGGLPTSVTLARNTAGANATTLVSSIQYEPYGEPAAWNWELTSGVQPYQRIRDASGRLVRYRLGGVLRDLSYDAADRITGYTHFDAATGAALANLDQGFGYDELGRLTSVTYAANSWNIAYDDNGNRTSVTLNGATSIYTTPPTSNRLSSTTNPTRTFGYDAAGNVTADTYSATYNLQGRLSSVTKAGVTTTYTVDGLGKRVRKFSSSGSASTVMYVYDQAGHLLGEYDSTAKEIREYIWLGDIPIAVFTPNPNVALLPLVYYIHADHLNAPRVAMDRSNNLRWRWLTEPFGTGVAEEDPSSLGALQIALRLPGQLYDAETGLHYNGFRDYDPLLGRYTQSDPIGLQGGINTYAYVGGNPLSYTDPDGLQTTAIPAPLLSSVARPNAGTLVNPFVSPGVNPNDPNDGGESDKCRNLRKKVENLRKEVFDKRIPGLAANRGNLPMRIGPGEALRDTVRGHEKLLNRQWRRLNELEDQYVKECGC